MSEEASFRKEFIRLRKEEYPKCKSGKERKAMIEKMLKAGCQDIDIMSLPKYPKREMGYVISNEAKKNLLEFFSDTNLPKKALREFKRGVKYTERYLQVKRLRKELADKREE